MKHILKEKLHNYLLSEHPDLLNDLQEDQGITAFIEQKVEGVTSLMEELGGQKIPEYIIVEKCMDALAGEFPPSRYNYILNVLEEEFSNDFLRFQANGILRWEVLNMLRECAQVFDAFDIDRPFEESRELYYAVTGTLHEYLMQQSQENY
ncbi:DUF1896 family protein [Negadavirga shengliensis]|uniref:DUF1896 family protein n=1 Tax=Negadavirga shengliensis TaxID=1389218 RepID=A0ABV9T0W6_9BACT